MQKQKRKYRIVKYHFDEDRPTRLVEVKGVLKALGLPDWDIEHEIPHIISMDIKWKLEEK